MSSFRTVLVRDSTLGDLTDDIDYAVLSGGSQCTYQAFPTTSASNSAAIWNVQIPSENVVIGRDVLINTGLTFRLNLGSATVAANQVPALGVAMDIGNSDALHAFPLNSLFTTATAQINNTTVSCNVQDVLPSLLRMNNSRQLYAANSCTASLPDQAYGEYADGVGTSNNPLAGYNTSSYDVDQVPRGAFPLTYTVEHFTVLGGAVPVDASLTASAAATDTWIVTISTIISEPLFLSPFIFGDGEFNKQGFLGINNMSFTFNIDSEAKRLWSTANNYVTSINLGSAANPNGFNYQAQTVGGAILQVPPASPQMLFKFLSSQPSDLIASKNIVPYMDFPRYLTSSANASAVASGATSLLTSSNVQINQIPDLFIINIRKPMATQNSSDADAFFKINNISINLNNQSGLLSSSSAYDLWKMSVRNGSTQTWAEFGGQSQASAAVAGDPTTRVVTTGSLLIINPAYDLSLPDYISCGSLGNYNFQFNVGVTNQFSDIITPEICTITVNSGIMSTQQGVSSIYTGILTKEMVLDAKSKQQASAVKSAEIKRMVGGSLFNMPLSAIASKIGKYLPLARQLTGLGTSGGGTSGGGTSGGAKKYC